MRPEEKARMINAVTFNKLYYRDSSGEINPYKHGYDYLVIREQNIIKVVKKYYRSKSNYFFGKSGFFDKKYLHEEKFLVIGTEHFLFSKKDTIKHIKNLDLSNEIKSKLITQANNLYWAMKEKSWEDVVLSEIREWANKEFEELTKDCDCCNNFRVANVIKSSQMRRYRKQQERGCCGSCDVIRVGPDGNRYLLGFNYGH